jgi:protein SCO1/2
MLCNQVLTGLTGSLKGINFTPGKEFEVVAISFDPKDTPEIAKAKKETYVANYGRPESANAWHFLTGTPESITKITEAVGFKYEWDEATKQFAHAGGIQIATPEGKLARYFYGIDYAPKDVKFGLMEASSSKIGNPVEQLVLYCYHYNPASGKYGLAIMNVVRLGGVATLIGLAAMLLFLRRYNSNKKDETANAA